MERRKVLTADGKNGLALGSCLVTGNKQGSLIQFE
jgi:hypothetical protein